MDKRSQAGLPARHRPRDDGPELLLLYSPIRPTVIQQGSCVAVRKRRRARGKRPGSAALFSRRVASLSVDAKIGLPLFGRLFAAVDARPRIFARSAVVSSCRNEPAVANISSWSVRARAPHGLGWADLAEGRLRLDRLPATAVRRISSPAANAAFLARQERLRTAVLRWRCGRKEPPHGAGAAGPRAVRCDRPSASDRHRGRDRRGPSNRRGAQSWLPSALSPSRATTVSSVQ
jgi:hypothetical protein